MSTGWSDPAAVLPDPEAGHLRSNVVMLRTAANNVISLIPEGCGCRRRRSWTGRRLPHDERCTSRARALDVAHTAIAWCDGFQHAGRAPVFADISESGQLISDLGTSYHRTRAHR